MAKEISPKKFTLEEHLNFAFDCVKKYAEATGNADIDPHKLVDFVLETKEESEEKTT